jgi:hypothetical protein
MSKLGYVLTILLWTILSSVQAKAQADNTDERRQPPLSEDEQPDRRRTPPPKDLKQHEAPTRIVGGTDVEKDTYPWFVAFDGCGGMLISPEYVLTAGTHIHTSYCLELHDILSSPYVVFSSSIYFF